MPFIKKHFFLFYREKTQMTRIQFALFVFSQ